MHACIATVTNPNTMHVDIIDNQYESCSKTSIGARGQSGCMPKLVTGLQLAIDSEAI